MKKISIKKLRTNVGEKCVKNYASFENVFLDTLKKHATPKNKVIRANHVPYVTKSLKKTDNQKVKFTDLFQNKATESLRKYKKQKNYLKGRNFRGIGFRYFGPEIKFREEDDFRNLYNCLCT